MHYREPPPLIDLHPSEYRSEVRACRECGGPFVFQIPAKPEPEPVSAGREIAISWAGAVLCAAAAIGLKHGMAGALGVLAGGFVVYAFVAAIRYVEGEP